MLNAGKWSWDVFKERTDIKGRSRGKNMKEVDDALKGYWDSLKDGPVAATQACFEVLKACNSWMKYKKDKNLEGKTKEHFKTRWTAIKELATAAFVETSAQMQTFNTGVGNAAIDYERKKLRSASTAARPTKALSGGYGLERQMWLDSKKRANPVSATTLHETINALTDPDAISYDANLARDFGGAKVLAKDFDSMTTKDWIAIDKIMQKIDAGQGTMKRHVAFLDKADRLQHMAIVDQGRLKKNNGTLWDTGTWDEPFAMDAYGNLFIGVAAAIVTPTARLNHSSLLAGKDVLCAGTLRVQGGILKRFNNNSGHYKPTGVNVYQGLLALQDEHVDLSQTLVTIKISEHHGFGDLTVAEVMAAQGQFTAPHPKYY